MAWIIDNTGKCITGIEPLSEYKLFGRKVFSHLSYFPTDDKFAFSVTDKLTGALIGSGESLKEAMEGAADAIKTSAKIYGVSPEQEFVRRTKLVPGRIKRLREAMGAVGK